MSSNLLKRIEVFFGIAVELVLDFKVFFDILDPLIDFVILLTIGFDTQVFFSIIVALDYSVHFTISLHDFIHLHLGLAKQQQLALLQLVLVCSTNTSLSY